jgi:iron(III) transport system ATP-binding protein
VNVAAPLLLDIRHLCVRLGDTLAVEDLSLSLAPGELACLLGPSGCGKTSVLRVVAGLQEAQGGQVLLRGRNMAGVQPEARRIGLVFQDLALFPHLDVAGNVAFGLRRMPRGEREQRVRDALSMLDLGELAGRWPHELSGGQQQRVALARTLSTQPDLVLLDEPFAALDTHLRQHLREELRTLLKRLGIAALLVTHDQDEAFAFADSVGVMRAGKLEQWASPYEIYHQPTTPFVAGFVGEGRLLPGKVVARGRVQTELGTVEHSGVATLAPDSEVTVLLRPDDIQPDPESPLFAVVSRVAFRGAETLYDLVLPSGHVICALFPSHLSYRPGDRVGIRTDIAHGVVFPAEASVLFQAPR